MTNNVVSGIPAALRQTMREQLDFVYGSDIAAKVSEELYAIIEAYKQDHPSKYSSRPPLRELITQKDGLLITYGDTIVEPGKAPLQTLGAFLNRYLAGTISGVHFLPFFPYTSDYGFSVVDYYQINPELGTWDDVASMRGNFRMMFDYVANHVSASNEWFKAFLRDDPKYKGYFIVVEPETDLSQVFRPRALPLLTTFETPSGTKHVWTTFSADQIDLNYANPELLLDMIRIMLMFVANGSDFLRMDAVTFLWKTIGTVCVHLPQGHRIIQLFRTVLDAAAPEAVIITETNVPHKDNISYFGDGNNEAQLVYQFPLAGLVIHSFATGNARPLIKWATELEPTGEQTAFFNFLACHDGIGVVPAEAYLSTQEIGALADQVLAHGGKVSFRNLPDGSKKVYELNITWFDMLSDPNSPEPHATKIDRHIASQAIMLAMAGMPGIYIHSLFGTHNDYARFEQTGWNRSVNHHQWDRAELEGRLSNPSSHEAQVFARYTDLLKVRAQYEQFNPFAAQRIVSGNEAVFGVLRGEGDSALLCLHNVSGQTQSFSAKLDEWSKTGQLTNITNGQAVGSYDGSGQVTIEVAPYSVMWLQKQG